MSIEPAAAGFRVWPTSTPIPPLPAAPVAVATPFRFAWFSYGLIGLLVVVYLAELALKLEPGAQPQLTTLSLTFMGGLDRQWALGRHEYWRVLTHAFLHLDATHLTGNCVVLWLIGPPLERAIGWRWSAAVFALGAIAGGIATLIWVPNLAVGASGGIVGLLGAAIPAAICRLDGRRRLWLLLRAGVLLVLTFWQLPGTGLPFQVDTAAHLAGGLVGLLIWPLLLGPKTGPVRGQLYALAIDGVFAVWLVLALFPLSQDYLAGRKAMQQLAASAHATQPSSVDIPPAPTAIKPGTVVEPSAPADTAAQPAASRPAPGGEGGPSGLMPPRPLQFIARSTVPDYILSKVVDKPTARATAGASVDLGHFYTVSFDCSPFGPPTIFQIVSAPQHGTLVPYNGYAVGHFPSGRYADCDGRVVAALILGYLANTGYTGPDFVEYLAVQPNRTTDIRVPIFVAAP